MAEPDGGGGGDGGDGARYAEVLREALPGRVGDVAMHCVAGDIARSTWGGRVHDGLRITLQLVIYDGNGIRDIKEQQVYFAQRRFLDESPARVEASLRAWARVLTKVFEGGSAGAFETLMPHDLVHERVLELKKAHSEEDFVKALSERSRLGRWFAPEHPALPLERIADIYRERMPGGEHGSLELVEAGLTERGHRTFTLRLITWDAGFDDAGNANRTISGIKEQQVYIGPGHVDEARLVTFVDAWNETLSRAFDVAPLEVLETLMPHELTFLDALMLPSATSKDDFIKALSQRSRLGKLLESASPSSSQPPAGSDL